MPKFQGSYLIPETRLPFVDFEDPGCWPTLPAGTVVTRLFPMITNLLPPAVADGDDDIVAFEPDPDMCPPFG